MLCLPERTLFAAFYVKLILMGKGELFSVWPIDCQKIFSIALAERSSTNFITSWIVVVLLANTKKSLKFYCLESVQNFLSFFNLKFILFCLFLINFAAEAGIVPDMLNFVQKWTSCSYKIAFIEEIAVDIRVYKFHFHW